MTAIYEVETFGHCGADTHPMTRFTVQASSLRAALTKAERQLSPGERVEQITRLAIVDVK